MNVLLPAPFSSCGRGERRSGAVASLLRPAVVCLLLSACQAFSAGDSVATIDADLTMYAAENEAIRAAATAEQVLLVEKVVAAGTEVAAQSQINAALGATLRANFTQTPEVQPVVVSADDMGDSLNDDMMDGTGDGAGDGVMRVSNLATAAGIDQNSGCSSGAVRQFSSNAERIYVTARVSSLIANSIFAVDWLQDGRTLLNLSWQADYSRAFECIWFFVTAADFPFAPGSYSATLFVDGEPVGNTTFTIVDT